MTDAETPETRSRARFGFVLEIGVNVLLPLAIYYRLKRPYGDVHALLASSVPPLVWSVIELVRRRRIDALSLLVLAGVVLSLLGYLGGGGMHMLQLREKLVTVLIGCVFLGSVAIGRPLIYEIARAGEARKSAEDLASLEAMKDAPRFRRAMRIMTLVWGVGLLAEAAVSATFVFILSIGQYMIVGPILGYGSMGLLALWTLWYSRRLGAPA